MSEARLRSGVRDYFTPTPEQVFIFVNVFARAINQLPFSSGNKWQSRTFVPAVIVLGGASYFLLRAVH